MAEAALGFLFTGAGIPSALGLAARTGGSRRLLVTAAPPRNFIDPAACLNQNPKQRSDWGFDAGPGRPAVPGAQWN